MDIAAQFPNARGLRTRAGAQKRVNKALAHCGPFAYVIVQREPDPIHGGGGDWLPIAFLPDRISNAIHIINFGLCVTDGRVGQ